MAKMLDRIGDDARYCLFSSTAHAGGDANRIPADARPGAD